MHNGCKGQLQEAALDNAVYNETHEEVSIEKAEVSEEFKMVEKDKSHSFNQVIKQKFKISKLFGPYATVGIEN